MNEKERVEITKFNIDANRHRIIDGMVQQIRRKGIDSALEWLVKEINAVVPDDEDGEEQ